MWREKKIKNFKLFLNIIDFMTQKIQNFHTQIFLMLLDVEKHNNKSITEMQSPSTLCPKFGKPCYNQSSWVELHPNLWTSWNNWTLGQEYYMVDSMSWCWLVFHVGVWAQREKTDNHLGRCTFLVGIWFLFLKKCHKWFYFYLWMWLSSYRSVS
jgi:hypothetical protein